MNATQTLSLSTADAARLAGVGYATAWRWAAEGRVRAHRDTRGRWRIDAGDLEAKLSQLRTTTTTTPPSAA